MKVAVICRSYLLKKGVQKFLGSDLATLAEADLVVTDCDETTGKPTLVIGGSGHGALGRPFTKAQLAAALDRVASSVRTQTGYERRVDWDALEAKIDKLTRAYNKKLLEIIRESYETR